MLPDANHLALVLFAGSFNFDFDFLEFVVLNRVEALGYCLIQSIDD